jgi:hypothetical protein
MEAKQAIGLSQQIKKQKPMRVPEGKIKDA